MSLHTYHALDAHGRLVKGSADAIDLGDLEQRLQRRGLELIRGRASGFFSGLSRQVPRRERIHFCFHLEQLLAAGVPIIESLTDLRDATAHPLMQQTVAQLLEDIEAGLPLSEAAANSPRVFGPVFCSLLQVGEQTGTLAPVLRQLAQALIREDELIAHARKLAIYPLIVCTVLGAAVLVALLFVVPQLAQLFRSTGQTLPLQTRVLIGLSSALASHGWMLVSMIPTATIAAVLAVRRDPALRLRLDSLRLRLPVFGEIQYKLAMARIASLIAMLYASGITVIDALRTAENASGNLAIRDSLRQANQHITEGYGITAAFERTGLFPQLVTRMLKIGEQTGSIDTALGNIAQFYARDTRESIERLQASAEPLLTVMLGGFMLWIVFAVLGPVYDILTRLPA